jgi:DNA polymerase III gamma/tau subunit
MRIAQAAEGSVRDGLSLFDQVLAFSGSRVDDKDVVELLGLIDRDLIMRATSAVIENDSLDALALVEALATYGADYRQFARDLLLYWRELLVLKIAPESEISGLLPDDRRRALVHTAALSEEDLLRICDLLARAEIDLRNSLDPRVALELTLLKAAQLRRLLPFSDLVARVEALAAGRPDPRTLSRSTRQESPPRQPPAAPVSPSVVALRGATGLSFAPDADAPSLSSSPAPAHAHAHVKDPLDRLRQAASGRALLTTVLARATAEVDGSLVSLRVPSEVEAAARGQVASLEALAQATLGSETRIRIVSDAPASGAAALSGDADPPRPPLASPVPETSTRPRASRVSKAARDELMKKAADDPGVQQVALTFGGSLTDVRPLERTTPEAPGSEEERNGPESVDEPGRDTRGAGRV